MAGRAESKKQQPLGNGIAYYFDSISPKYFLVFKLMALRFIHLKHSVTMKNSAMANLDG
jgi:hypothetical protein